MGIRLFKVSHDGGPTSGVTGYWLIEWKERFSIVLLRFSKGSREAFHSHAFNAYTFWLKGKVVEHFPFTDKTISWEPSFRPKFTPRNNMHKIVAQQTSWALSFRGPWSETWQEQKDGETYTLAKGRKRVN